MVEGYFSKGGGGRFSVKFCERVPREVRPPYLWYFDPPYGLNPKSYGAVVPWFRGPLGLKRRGPSGLWRLGSVELRFRGPVELWRFGSVVPWGYASKVAWCFDSAVLRGCGALVPWIPWSYGASESWRLGSVPIMLAFKGVAYHAKNCVL